MMTSILKTVEEAAKGAIADDPRYRNIFQGDWIAMPDSDGDGVLVGIRGRSGACAISSLTHEEAGIDFVEMQPGTAFPPHFHDGDHWIIGIGGVGSINIKGEQIPITPGMTLFVRGTDTHAVQGPPKDAKEPLLFVFFSDLHKHLADPNRMHKPHDHNHDH
jgi:quercetin dioxygenase-like cupin family protein